MKVLTSQAEKGADEKHENMLLPKPKTIHG